METRTFGNTGLEVTTLGYGAMELRHVDEAQSERLLNRVLDLGINFIDTAPDYGHSEDMIGKFISQRRDEYLLATKCGCNIPHQEDRPRHIWTGDQLRHNIEHSLRRLQTDYVDVWQIHSAYPKQLEGTDVLETMQQIQEEGKVRHIAVSMAGSSEGRGYVQLRGYLEWEAFEAFQVWYSAFARYSEAALHTAAAQGRGMIIRGSVRVEQFESIAEGFEKANLDELIPQGESRAQFLIRYVLSHPATHTNIVGTSNLEHLEDDVVAAEAGPLPDDVLTEARKRLQAAGCGVGLNRQPPE